MAIQQAQEPNKHNLRNLILLISCLLAMRQHSNLKYCFFGNVGLRALLFHIAEKGQTSIRNTVKVSKHGENTATQHRKAGGDNQASDMRILRQTLVSCTAHFIFEYVFILNVALIFLHH